MAGDGRCWGPLQRCHLIPKQRIKRAFPDGAVFAAEPGGEPRWVAFDARMAFAAVGAPERRLSIDKLMWDPRVWVRGCWGHHQAADHLVFRLLREELPAEVEEYAEQFGLVWSLDRDYGAAETPATTTGGTA